MKLLGLDELGEVGSFEFSLGSWGYWDKAIGGPLGLSWSVKEFIGTFILYCGVKWAHHQTEDD